MSPRSSPEAGRPKPALRTRSIEAAPTQLVGLTLLRLRLLLGDVLDRAGVRILQPLTPERVVDERVRAVRVLRLDVAQLQNAHVVRIRIAVQIAVDVERNLHVGETLLEPLDALEELGTPFDAVARARTAEDESLVRLLVVVDGELVRR